MVRDWAITNTFIYGSLATIVYVLSVLLRLIFFHMANSECLAAEWPCFLFFYMIYSAPARIASSDSDDEDGVGLDVVRRAKQK